MERLIAWLADKVPGRRRPRRAGARRLAHRQHDLRRALAAPARGARLGAVDARPSVRRPRLPVHAMAAAERAGIADSAASTARRTAYRPKPNMSRPIAGAWGSKRFPTGPSSSPSASSAASRSTRASTSARSTATPRIRSSPGKFGESVPLVAHVAWEGVEAGSLSPVLRLSPTAREPPCRRWARHANRRADLAASVYASPSAPERWQSGRSRRTRNAEYAQAYRGFESLPLRHLTEIRPVYQIVMRLNVLWSTNQPTTQASCGPSRKR